MIGSGSEGGQTESSSDDASVATDSSGGQVETDTESASESESETDEPPDACPATPELLEYVSTLDGSGYAVEYLGGDGTLEWIHVCVVASDVGTLGAGEIIELDCTDSEGQPVAHELEVLVDVDAAGAPNKIAVSVGQQVELSMWVTVWFSGTFAWVLRDVDHNVLFANYNSPLFPGSDPDDTPNPEFLAPITVALNNDVCPLVCPEEHESTTAGFVPGDGCCEEETALVFDLGDGPVEILDASAGTIPGPAGAYAVVATSVEVDTWSCEASDQNDAYYRFSVIGQ